MAINRAIPMIGAILLASGIGAGMSFATESSIDTVNNKTTAEMTQSMTMTKQIITTKYSDPELHKLTDEQLTQLACTKVVPITGSRSCYKGPTDEMKYYGTTTIQRNGNPTEVQLISTNGGGALIDLIKK